MLHSTDLAGSEPYLDAMRMKPLIGQDILNKALSQPTRTLILLQDNRHGKAGLDVMTIRAIHDRY